MLNLRKLRFHCFPPEMGLSTAELREIKSAVISVFNDKFLQEIADKVAGMVEKRFEAQLAAQEEEIRTIRTKIQSLEDENKRLRADVDNQEQIQRNLNVRIFGIAAEPDENLQSKIMDLFTNKLKVNIPNSDIANCYRVQSKTPTPRPPAVLVRFSTESFRASVLKNRNNLKNSGIHIKEDLTKPRLALFKRAVEVFSVNNSWVLNGNIYIKCNNKVHRISSETDLLKLKSDH